MRRVGCWIDLLSRVRSWGLAFTLIETLYKAGRGMEGDP
jgi:hypothetical protein